RKTGYTYGKSVLQVVLAWLISQPVITAPIIGVNTIEQLQAGLGVIRFRLSVEEMQRLDEASGGPFHWND
ncbi:MAG: aldo/keto reductase, partial [Candidatus Binatia bacterium]|nr:aldo/keto reductase [Candidatus Binatia bacterium]